MILNITAKWIGLDKKSLTAHSSNSHTSFMKVDEGSMLGNAIQQASIFVLPVTQCVCQRQLFNGYFKKFRTPVRKDHLSSHKLT